jgi:hypothetical protein
MPANAPDTLPADFNFGASPSPPAQQTPPAAPDTLPANFDFSSQAQPQPQSATAQGGILNRVDAAMDKVVPAVTSAIDELRTRLPHIADYMQHLDGIMRAGQSIGWKDFGLKEAADVHKSATAQAATERAEGGHK